MPCLLVARGMDLQSPWFLRRHPDRCMSQRVCRRGCCLRRFVRCIRLSRGLRVVHGAVVVEAIISRTGTIESLHVVSGPLMLQGAALDAIREARYRPVPAEWRADRGPDYDYCELLDGRIKGRPRHLPIQSSPDTQEPGDGQTSGTAEPEFDGKICWTTGEVGTSVT